jgi:thiamine-monophosphate kinase
MDISDGLGVDAGHIAHRSGVRCVLELDLVPLAPGATPADLAFGEDYELLAAVAEPGELAVIGRIESGEGVLVLRAGEPVELAGWQHFS